MAQVVRYVITPGEPTSAQLAAAIEGAATARRSCCGRVILKWSSEEGSPVPDAFAGLEVYSKAEMKVELRNPEWTWTFESRGLVDSSAAVDSAVASIL